MTASALLTEYIQHLTEFFFYLKFWSFLELEIIFFFRKCCYRISEIVWVEKWQFFLNENPFLPFFGFQSKVIGMEKAFFI